MSWLADPLESIPQQLVRWFAFSDQAAVQRGVLRVLTCCAEAAIRTHGAFHLVLSGGSTPSGVYGMCREFQTDWSAWHIYFGDERCFSAESAARNSSMAGSAWLAHVPIPPAQIHVIPAERGPQQGADIYAQTLRGVGRFDLVLLGLGEDGHTASLFPGRTWGLGDNAPDVLPVFDAPKPPAERVSLSARRLAHAGQVVFMVTGAEKAGALKAWRDGCTLPARAIAPAGGVDVFYERCLLEQQA